MKCGFSKNAQIPTFMKICPQGAEVFHEDGQADMSRLIIASRNFANAHKETKYADSHPRHEQNPKAVSMSERWKRVHIPQFTGRVIVLSPMHQTYSRRLYLLLCSDLH
jgi:hypothetical protein